MSYFSFILGDLNQLGYLQLSFNALSSSIPDAIDSIRLFAIVIAVFLLQLVP